METEAILKYLGKYGPQTTFRLARILKIDRRKVISILHKLADEGVVEFKRGIARALKKEIPLVEPIKVEKEKEKKKKVKKVKPRKIPKPPAISAEKLEELERNLSRTTQGLRKKTMQIKELGKKISELEAKPKVIVKRVKSKAELERVAELEEKLRKQPEIKKVKKELPKPLKPKSLPVVPKKRKLKFKKLKLPKLGRKIKKIRFPKMKIPKLKLPKIKLKIKPKIKAKKKRGKKLFVGIKKGVGKTKRSIGKTLSELLKGS